MEIAIRSECDSRIMLYPLIKVLSLYGTVAVYSSNKCLTRLIESELEGGFKNIRIVVNTEGDADAAKESDEFYKGKYNYLIYDNMSVIDYDTCITLVTNRLSESYVMDLQNLIADPKVHIIKFGKPAPIPKGEKPVKDSSPKKPPKGEVEEESDISFNKWDNTKTDEELLQEALSDRESKWCKFPSYEAIEEMEGRQVMMVPESFYLLMKDNLRKERD